MGKIWSWVKLGSGAAAMLAVYWVWWYESKVAAFALACVAGLMAGVIDAIENSDA